MPRLAWVAPVFVLLAAGCRTSLGPDLESPDPALVDLARPPVDAAVAPVDLAQPPPVRDLAVPVDFAAPPDLTTPRPPDLTTPPPSPDFSVLVRDMAMVPMDLAVRPPDLVTIPDLTVARDLVAAPDMANAYPAPHTALPQVQNAGGPRLLNPRLYSVTFSGDAAAAALDAYVAALPKSAWWTAVMTDYGVGAGSAANPVHLVEAAPARIDDAAIQTWLAGKLDGTHPEFGVPDNNSLYILEYPSTTTVTLQGAASCQQFGGYHSSTTLRNGQYVAYAVIGRCRADALNPGLTLNQVAAVTISHEVAEAATDATPLVMPAYSTVDVASHGWEMAAGAEVADLCLLVPGNVITPNDLPLPVARSWSNAAARKDQDPCVPAPQGVTYFNSAPVLPGRITNPYEGTQVPGVRLAVGASTSITVELFSSGPTAAWTVSAVDILSLGGGQPYLTFSWNRTTGVNGDKLTLTITRVRQGPNAFEPFLIRSVLNGYTTHWQVAVANR